MKRYNFRTRVIKRHQTFSALQFTQHGLSTAMPNNLCCAGKCVAGGENVLCDNFEFIIHIEYVNL